MKKHLVLLALFFISGCAVIDKDTQKKETTSNENTPEHQLHRPVIQIVEHENWTNTAHRIFVAIDNSNSTQGDIGIRDARDVLLKFKNNNKLYSIGISDMHKLADSMDEFKNLKDSTENRSDTGLFFDTDEALAMIPAGKTFVYEIGILGEAADQVEKLVIIFANSNHYPQVIETI